MSDRWLEHGHGAEGTDLTRVFSSSSVLTDEAGAPPRATWTSGWRAVVVGGSLTLLATLGVVGVANAIGDNLFPSMGSTRPASVWQNPVPPAEPTPTTVVVPSTATTAPTTVPTTSNLTTAPTVSPTTTPSSKAVVSPSSSVATSVSPTTSTPDQTDDDRVDDDRIDDDPVDDDLLGDDSGGSGSGSGSGSDDSASSGGSGSDDSSSDGTDDD